MATAGRTYAGATAEERRADRRRKLLDAALEVFGTPGGAASIEGVCAAAKVSTSHCYQEFRSRDALVAALFDEVGERVAGAITEATAAVPMRHEDQVRAGVGAYLDAVTADERVARVLVLVPHAGNDALLPHRRAVSDGFTALLEAGAQQLVAAGELPDRDYHLTSAALVGAGNELLCVWLTHEPRPPVEAIREELVRLHLTAVR